MPEAALRLAAPGFYNAPVQSDADKLTQSYVDSFLNGTDLPVSEPSACPYLPEKLSQSQGFCVAGKLDGEVYQALMDRGGPASIRWAASRHCRKRRAMVRAGTRNAGSGSLAAGPGTPVHRQYRCCTRGA